MPDGAGSEEAQPIGAKQDRPIALPIHPDQHDWFLARQPGQSHGAGAASARGIRSAAQRDRDRILYSSAFQRLGFVTQVSAPEAGRVFHTRLTHSLKVGQVARRTAERLKANGSGKSTLVAQALSLLDPEIAEAAALAHDLGHPPFGHLAEEALDELAREKTAEAVRFEGNAQSFRILTRLALRSHDELGLGLTRQTLNGVLKYPWLHNGGDEDRRKKWGAFDEDQTAFDWARDGIAPGAARTLEAHLMNWADDVTYAVHDLDDFFRARLIPLSDLQRTEGERRRFRDYLDRNDDGKGEPPAAMLDSLMDLFVADRLPNYSYRGSDRERVLLRDTGSELITRFISAVDVVENQGRAVFRVDAGVKREVEVLKALTFSYVIHRPELAVIAEGQKQVIRELFDFYLRSSTESLHVFPESAAERLEGANVEDRVRATVDLIAGLTEPAAYAIHARISGRERGALVGAPTPGT